MRTGAGAGVDAGVEAALLLHGQPGSARDWDRVRAAIGGRLRTLAIDRPGWDWRSSPASLAGNASAALAELDRRGLERAGVVGHSLGGAVAAWLAAEHPERVGALVLLAPSANLASLLWADRWLATPLAGQLIGAGGLAGVGWALAARPLRGRLAARLDIDDGYLRAGGRALRSPRSWRAFAADQRTLVRELPALEARLGRISAPTTIVAGRADHVVPLSSARTLARQIRGASLQVLDGADHLLVQRCPEQVAEIIVAASA